jgi:hypothetical protein
VSTSGEEPVAATGGQRGGGEGRADGAHSKEPEEANDEADGAHSKEPEEANDEADGAHSKEPEQANDEADGAHSKEPEEANDEADGVHMLINQNRTNIVPNLLLIICAVLFFARCAVIAYRTYLPQVLPSRELVWQEPAKLPDKPQDLLGRPYLYCFTDHSNPMNSLWSDAVAGYLLNNREIVHYMQDKYTLVKVDRLEDKKRDEKYNQEQADRKGESDTEDRPSNENDEEGGIVEQLSNRYNVYGLFEVVITLPEGTRVDSCNLATDRSFQALLQRAYTEKRFEVAAETAMLNCDFKTACQAYPKIDKERHSMQISDAYDLYWYIALRHEHRDQEAKQVLAQAMKDNSKYDKDLYPAVQYRYMQGEVSDDVLTDRCGDLTADYLMGEKLLLEGNTKEALEKFHRAIAKSKMSWSRNYKLARAELVAHGEKVPEREDNTLSTDQFDSSEF